MKYSGYLVVFILFVQILSCTDGSTGQRNTPKAPDPEKASPPENYTPGEKTERKANVGKDCVDSSKIDHDETCYDLYDPVCGCDSVTYSNACEARKSGVLKWQEGTCKENRRKDDKEQD